MIDHHFRIGISGLFLCGTNGEGPWLKTDDRRALVRAIVKQVRGRMPVAVQVTENSAPRIAANMKNAFEDGADIAVLGPPFFLFNASPENVLRLYREAIRLSPIPVGIYDRGCSCSVPVPDSILPAIYNEKKVVIIKDSSAAETRLKIALAARQRRPGLKLLAGDEFNCVRYMRAGYDGMLLGGGVFNGFLAGMMLRAAGSGDWSAAERLQLRMNRIMRSVYGGKKIKCWLAGEKFLLMELGLFNNTFNLLNYRLTAACRNAVKKTAKRDLAVLMPYAQTEQKPLGEHK